MEPRLQITLLGGFGVSVGNRPVQHFESNKVRALLAYLLLTHPRPQTRESLAGLLWPDLPEPRARRNLSQALYALRRTMKASGASDDWLKADPHIISCDPGSSWQLDVALFEQALAGCSDHAPAAHSCPSCLALAEEGVALYAGELLAGHSFPGCPELEAWLVTRREALHRRAQGALELIAAWHRVAGRLAEAQRYARQAVSLDPLWEPAWRQLIHCLWLSGRRSEALAQYETCRRHLEKELGLQPDPQTRRLAQRVREGAVARSPTAGQTLPHFLTPFIGRQNEALQLENCLCQSEGRLITVVGSGGSGKTRLAVEAAHRLGTRFRDGVCFVTLSGLHSSARLPNLIAAALGLVVDDTRPVAVQLRDYLHEKELLLLLDSFEQRLDAAAFVVELLQAAPALTLLATSRVRLGMAGEQLLRLDGLPLATSVNPVPPVGTAEELFLTAARRVLPAYDPAPEEWPGIGQICRQVAGNPLGVILAAAWLQTLGPHEIALQMAQNLDFLAADWPDLPTRQRSMRATLGYSYSLLDAQRQLIFARLAVFAGGFSLEAAQGVAAASAHDLRLLIERSLLRRDRDGRFQVHDLLREYAAEKLAAAQDEQAATAERHGYFFLTRLQEAGAVLVGEGQAQMLGWLERESGNVAAAWIWAVDHERWDWLLPAIESRGLFCDLLGRIEEGLEAFVALAGLGETTLGMEVPPGAGLTAPIWQARFARRLGLQAEAQAICQKTRERLQAQDPGGANDAVRAFLHLEFGNLHQHADREKAVQFYNESLACYRRLADSWGCAQALAKLGMIAHHRGTYDQAIARHQESLRHYETLGNRRGRAGALLELGHNAMRLHRLDAGEEYIRASVQQLGALGDHVSAARSQLNLARLNYWMGNLPQMLTLLKQCVPTLVDAGLLSDAAFAQGGLPLGHALLGDYQAALHSGDASLALARRAGVARAEALALAGLGAASLALGDRAGAALYISECIELARRIEQREELATGLSMQGRQFLELGAAVQARHPLQEALQICLTTRSMWSVFHTLPFVAYYLAAVEEPLLALETYALVTRYPPAAIPLNEDLAGRPIARLTSALPPAVATAARERGAAAELWPFVDTLLRRLGRQPAGAPCVGGDE